MLSLFFPAILQSARKEVSLMGKLMFFPKNRKVTERRDSTFPTLVEKNFSLENLVRQANEAGRIEQFQVVDEGLFVLLED